MAETDGRQAQREERLARQEQRVTDREQNLSSIRSSLSEQVKEQQELQQTQIATINAHWAELNRERRDIAEAKTSARTSVNRSIQDCNDVTKKVRINVDQLNELIDGVERTKADIRSNRSDLENRSSELQDVQTLLQETKAMIAAVDNERHRMFARLSFHDSRPSIQQSQPLMQSQVSDLQQHDEGASSSPRKRAHEVSSTEVSPRKPGEPKRTRSMSLSPVSTRHASPVQTRDRHPPSEAALKGSRLPISGASIRRPASNTRGRPSTARRMGLGDLASQREEASSTQPLGTPFDLSGALPGPSRRGEETSPLFLGTSFDIPSAPPGPVFESTTALGTPTGEIQAPGGIQPTSEIQEAGDVSELVNDLPAVWQGVWQRLTLNLDYQDAAALAGICKKYFSKPGKKTSQSQQPIALLNRAANSKDPYCLISLLKALSPTHFNGRDGRHSCDNCKMKLPCLCVSWTVMGGTTVPDDQKQWTIDKRIPRA
ncbi:MAG: hypothetical protein Q9180_002792 [Flavoplaca navasiana]